MIIAEYTAEPEPPSDGSFGSIGVGRQPFNELVSQPLMISIQMVMRHVLRHHVTKVTLAQRDDPGKALGSYRVDESLRVGIEVGTQIIGCRDHTPDIWLDDFGAIV